ncbi:RusA family crossover junction endodeoxyribonuclease [Pantoea sp. GD03673]|uniref:RusA family crossover junction endodeoxyribonuclease n=1 Tax=Pantoea sp. GD03673 TaxID=2975364 RepID=UPI00244B3C93|nr:RusA family crossover junction endodeoxyribonuclease [Pantoea sp. GD03673]MDH2066872.1 RusA family crossover junction endodeoxyribonuclease [Pantoea sp. GD03673]
MKLILPFPPGVNTYWRNTRERVWSSASGRCLRANALASVKEQLKHSLTPFTANVEVRVMLFPPDKRQRDLNNYHKALFDGLTHVGVWGDDSPIKRFTVEWGATTKKGKTEVTITPFEEVSA